MKNSSLSPLVQLSSQSTLAKLILPGKILEKTDQLKIKSTETDIYRAHLSLQGIPTPTQVPMAKLTSWQILKFKSLTFKYK